jgi:hypothetical protein
MEKHFFEATAEPRKWRMQFMKLRNNQAAPRIIAGEQARQINAAAISLQIFIRRYRSTALPTTIGHAHARMARGIGAQKPIQIGDGKQPYIAIRSITTQPSPRCPFTQGKDLRWHQVTKGKAPGSFSGGIGHGALAVSGRLMISGSLDGALGHRPERFLQ